MVAMVAHLAMALRRRGRISGRNSHGSTPQRGCYGHLGKTQKMDSLRLSLPSRASYSVEPRFQQEALLASWRKSESAHHFSECELF